VDRELSTKKRDKGEGKKSSLERYGQGNLKLQQNVKMQESGGKHATINEGEGEGYQTRYAQK
jgi:hypothetical protein